MKTLSVKEVAEVLGMTPRGVIQRLNRGQLKGTKKLNQFGIHEWQVYANREILMAAEAQKAAAGAAVDNQSYSFAPDASDTVDAEDIEVNSEYADQDGPSNWREVELARLEVLAEKLVKPLAERLEAQAIALREQEKVIEDQNRQLRLLPDLQKEAEQQRQDVELKYVENEALKKQIAALQEQVEASKRSWWMKWFSAPADQGTQR